MPRPRSPLTSRAAIAIATIGVAATISAPPAAAIDRFARCSADSAEGARLADPAERLREPDFSEREVEVQGLSQGIEDAMRASSARKDYLGMSFDHDPVRTYVYVRNHKHDKAIRLCARQLGINRYVRIKIHRWSMGQLLGAILKTERAVDDLYDAGLFECSYGATDRFYIEVYKGATDAQVARIRKAAKATKVAFELTDRKHERPVPVDQ